VLRRRSKSVTTTTAATTGNTSSGLRGLFQITPCSSTPRAIADAVIAGRFVSRPIIRAASASRRAENVSAETTGRPTMPARRKMPTNESSAATAHTTVCSRCTGTPRRLARSARSALARTAMPTDV
jgi:hypothetical protein